RRNEAALGWLFFVSAPLQMWLVCRPVALADAGGKMSIFRTMKIKGSRDALSLFRKYSGGN
ncbi:MAG: hypothetical protein ACPGVS_02985, partial [Primorskyibacter sp.]